MDFTIAYSRFDVMSSDVRNYENRGRVRLYLRFFINWISDSLKQKVYTDYTRLNTELLGLSKFVLENPAEITRDDYEKFMRIVTTLSRMNALYRKIDYMDSAQIRDLMNDTLNLAFEIEADIKLTVLSANPITAEDKDYQKSLSAVSQKAINKKLSLDNQ